MATVHRESHWTPEQDGLLDSLARSGHLAIEIASQLKRSVGSVQMRAARLDIVLPKSKKLTNCPGWLSLNEDKTAFVVLPDRAAIVRNIFEMSASGLGGYTIAKQLNSKNVPAFGPSAEWNQSTIHSLLQNIATVGQHQPRRYEKQKPAEGSARPPRDRKGSPEGDILRGYYPAVIDEELFDKAQIARQQNLSSGRGRKGSLITNLFGNIPTCAYCGAPVKFHSNGSAKSLICSNVIARKGCYRSGWSYRDFENSFFALIKSLVGDTALEVAESASVAELLRHINQSDGPHAYDARLALLIKLKADLTGLKISSSGRKPELGKLDARIRRDRPGRFFEITMRNGSVRRGFALGN